VIYPPSLQPAFAKNIPIRVLNTFNPSFVGTVVSRQAGQAGYIITGISSIDNLALVNLQGSGMIGVAGVSGKLFTILAKHKISVVLISQALTTGTQFVLPSTHNIRNKYVKFWKQNLRVKCHWRY
jgi:aspartokinase/homoserine dehydrogenase 1